MAWRRERQRSALFVGTSGSVVLDLADRIRAFLSSPSTADSVHVTTLGSGGPRSFACDLLEDGNSA